MTSRKRSTVLGLVTSVYTHTDSEDLSNHEANVKAFNDVEEFRRIPIHVGRSGHAIVPQVGDAVEVSFEGSETQSPYISDFLYTNEDRAPLAEEGHYRHRFGDGSPYLFIEAEPKDHGATDTDFDSKSSQNPVNVVRMGVKPDGLSDPTTNVEIDNSTDPPTINIDGEGDVNITGGGDITVDGESNITVEAAGDISVSAGGNVVIDEGGGATPVLTEDAVFEYEQRVDTSDGSGGTTTQQTTTVSNGEVTDVEID